MLFVCLFNSSFDAVTHCLVRIAFDEWPISGFQSSFKMVMTWYRKGKGNNIQGMKLTIVLQAFRSRGKIFLVYCQGVWWRFVKNRVPTWRYQLSLVYLKDIINSSEQMFSKQMSCDILWKGNILWLKEYILLIIDNVYWKKQWIMMRKWGWRPRANTWYSLPFHSTNSTFCYCNCFNQQFSVLWQMSLLCLGIMYENFWTLIEMEKNYVLYVFFILWLCNLWRTSYLIPFIPLFS